MMYFSIACCWIVVMFYAIKTFSDLRARLRENVHQNIEETFKEAEEEKPKKNPQRKKKSHNQKLVLDEDFDFPSDTLDEILESVTLIKESSDQLKPGMQDFTESLFRLNELKNQTDILMRNCYEDEFISELEKALQDTEKSIIRNGKDIIVLCSSSVKNKHFSPDKEILDKIGGECRDTRDMITKCETLLSVVSRLSIKPDSQETAIELNSITKALETVATLKGR